MSIPTNKELFDSHAFDLALQKNHRDLPIYQAALADGNRILQHRFQNNTDIVELIYQRAFLVDQLLTRAYTNFVADLQTALVAVGGYGRGELHPGSDIDLMVLLPPKITHSTNEQIAKFITFLWDLGLDVGHSVRTIEECVAESKNDITIATNIIESRLIAGSYDLFKNMRNAVGPDYIWSSRTFFEAKLAEQNARHHKYHDTAYNLEPNIKEGPGGLRDIQMIAWVAKRHFGDSTLHQLVVHGFLNEAEYRSLMVGQKFLWKIRFGLHVLAKRREDRLLFDYQRTLAKQFAYKDDGPHLAVELFMKQYYRTIMELGRLNEMLLQLFLEAILLTENPSHQAPLNKRFNIHKGFIDAAYDSVFKHYPFALLEIFLLLAQNQQLRGVTAKTIRLIRNHRHLIDDAFRNDLRCRSVFMEIIRQPKGVTEELRRMNRYGILAEYLPIFGNIVGQMQHDLFHHYTVDEHTLFVIRNLRRFTVPKFSKEFPLCSKIIQQIPKTEILYLAGLFHDIAKGRGGDHSKLGAKDAAKFAEHHGLSTYDCNLIAWLVENHLLMSITAQRKDISDPNVITEFALKTGNQIHLNYLFLLTVADIRATNPNLWNSWKNALLTELYIASMRAFRRGLEAPLDKMERMKHTQNIARQHLARSKISSDQIDRFWENIDDDYFLRHSANRIAWQTKAILQSTPEDLPLVLIRQQDHRGGTEIFIYTQDREFLFSVITVTLDSLRLNIVDARIITTRNGFTLDTYIVLEKHGESVTDNTRLADIEYVLREKIANPHSSPNKISHHISRHVKQFPLATEVNFYSDFNQSYTVMEVITFDRPGLLSQISQALVQCNVRLINAKIATFGERAEDIFYILGKNKQPLADIEQLNDLRKTIIEFLNKS